MRFGNGQRTGTKFLREKVRYTLEKTQKDAIDAVRQSGREAVTMEIIYMGNTILYLFLVSMASSGTSYSHSV